VYTVLLAFFFIFYVKKLLISLIFSLAQLVITQFISRLAAANNTEVVLKILALEVLLGQVLQVTLAEGLAARHHNLALLAVDLNVPSSEVVGLAVVLDPVLEELFESNKVDNLVVNGDLAVNDELRLLGFGDLGGHFCYLGFVLLQGVVCSIAGEFARQMVC